MNTIKETLNTAAPPLRRPVSSLLCWGHYVPFVPRLICCTRLWPKTKQISDIRSVTTNGACAGKAYVNALHRLGRVSPVRRRGVRWRFHRPKWIASRGRNPPAWLCCDFSDPSDTFWHKDGGKSILLNCFTACSKGSTACNKSPRIPGQVLNLITCTCFIAVTL